MKLQRAFTLMFLFITVAAAQAAPIVVRVGHAPKPGLIEPIFLEDKPVTLDQLQQQIGQKAKNSDVDLIADPAADFGTVDKVTELLQLAGASNINLKREPMPDKLKGVQAAAPVAPITEQTEFVITFRPMETFRPRNTSQFEAAFTSELPKDAHYHHLRVRIDEGGLVGYVVAASRKDADAIRQILIDSDQLAFVGMEPATPLKIEMLDNLQDERRPQSSQSEPPRPVQITPDPGDTEVTVTLDAIRVTFNQDMDTSHAWTGEDYRPPLTQGETPRWIDARTCIYPVALEPGRFYRIGINSKTERGFRARAGMAASPDSVYFVTQGASLETIRLGLKPQIVRMEPQSGEGEIDPDIAELRVTFNVPMSPSHAWVGDGEHFPESPAGQEPRWSSDQRTCSLPVRLEPDWVYQLSLNGSGRTGFQSAVGVPLDPIYWTFQTRKGTRRSARGTSETVSLRIAVDPRIELISIIFRLAGNAEYNRGAVATYNRDIDRWFGGRKNHPAVQLARSLRKSRGVGYDAPMTLAIRLPQQMDELIGDDPWKVDTEGIDERWPKKETAAFLEQARQFAQLTRFDKFFYDHQSFYIDVCDRARRVIERDMHLDWFDKFFGARPGADFRVVIAPLMGGLNIGPSRHIGKREELYCILGVWFTDRRGEPAFSRDASTVAAHEFNHSYVNPVVDKHMDELEKYGKAIFPRVAAKMKRQAYGRWESMMYESLVRAAQICYVNDNRGEFWGRRALDEEVERGFLWTPKLVKLLEQYQKQRDTYPTLDSFFPRIVSAFEEISRTLPPEKNTTPVVVKLEPAHRDQDVDTTRTQLVVTFDRAMQPGASWVGGGRSFPEIAGKPEWSADRKTCALPVRLKRNTTYQLSLNSILLKGFKAEKGDPLDPVEWEFKTRE